MRVHAPHPTQHAACGAPSFVTVLVEPAFRVSTNQCKRCAKVLAARDSGRPVFSGFDDGTGNTGARIICDFGADCAGHASPTERPCGYEP